jgi:hypothetical protein
MTPGRNGPLSARSILASWLSAGWKVGAVLGGIYGAVYGAVATSGFFWFILIGLACGCVVGFFAGIAAGVINGAVIGALIGPFALRRGGPFARRLRAAFVAVATTEVALLPIQLTLGNGVPINDVALLTVPILAAAICLATTIAPAGYCCTANPRRLFKTLLEEARALADCGPERGGNFSRGKCRSPDLGFGGIEARSALVVERLVQAEDALLLLRRLLLE